MNSRYVESSFGLDRLATQDEVRPAMSSSSTQAATTARTRSPGALEFVGLRDDFSEVDSEASGRALKLRGNRVVNDRPRNARFHRQLKVFR